MTRIDKVMSELLNYIVPDDTEELKAIIMSRSCPINIACNGCADVNERIRCWKGEYRG